MNPSNWTNLFGTLTAISAAIMPIIDVANKFLAQFCTAGPSDFAATCNIPFLPASWMYVAAGVFGVITFALKVMRPGGFFHSMFGGTAVIVPPAQVGAGTVTQRVVDAEG